MAFEINSPRSAYIHVPFCRHRCGYCNFTLVAGRDDLIGSYLDCLAIEMKNKLRRPMEVDTLFIGGGTPSHLSIQALDQLLNLIDQWLPLASGGEYSCEANPLDIDQNKLDLLLHHGVNRLSLGGQSFQESKLRLLERDHSGIGLKASVLLAAQTFKNLSLDLIFATPSETLQQWQEDLHQALELPITHLSTYGLTMEPGANFWGRMLRGELTEADEERQVCMYEWTIKHTRQLGWNHYEVSNFAIPGYECKHNLTYWRGDCWWAFGPGASSFVPISYAIDSLDSATNTSIYSKQLGEPINKHSWLRATNHRSTTQYIKRIRSGKSSIHEMDFIDLEQFIREKLVFGLRQMQGIDLQELQKQWPKPIEALFHPYLEHYLEQKMLQTAGTHIRLTHQGLLVSDSLWPDLLCPSTNDARE